MRWLHTWVGLLLGWLIYVIFVTGTATYYRHEITKWMQPEAGSRPSGIESLEEGLDLLERIAPGADHLSVDLPADRLDHVLVGWRGEKGGRFERAVMGDGNTPLARDSKGGDFFYRFHFELQLPFPWGRYLAVIAAGFIVIALISGVITHRRFFADFFTFRPRGGSYRAMLDMHNVSAVVALPFYLMISLSGLLIFQYMIFPWVDDAVAFAASSKEAETSATSSVESAGETDKKGAREEDRGGAPDREAILAMARIAAEKWGGEQEIARFSFRGRGTESAEISFARAPHHGGISLPKYQAIDFDPATGREKIPQADSAAASGEEEASPGIFSRIRSGFYGLHLARFASPGLRFCFFFMGLLGSVLTASGLLLWTLKRSNDYRKSGGKMISFRLVEILNIAAITGVIVAIGAFFWANRLLPAGSEGRADLEVQCFLWAWAATLGHALLRPSRKAWVEQLYVVAGLFFLLPALDFALDSTFTREALRTGDTAYLGCLAAWVLIGVLSACIARRLVGVWEKNGGKKQPST